MKMRIFDARASKPGIMGGDLLQAGRELEVPAKGMPGLGCKIHENILSITENGIKIDSSFQIQGIYPCYPILSFLQ